MQTGFCFCRCVLALGRSEHAVECKDSRDAKGACSVGLWLGIRFRVVCRGSEFRVLCRVHLAVCLAVSRVYVGHSMHVGARGGVLTAGRAGLHCGWVHDSEWCAGAISFVYCARCGWHFAFADVNGGCLLCMCRLHLALGICFVDWICADIGLHLSPRTAVVPMGRATWGCGRANDSTFLRGIQGAKCCRSCCVGCSWFPCT